VWLFVLTEETAALQSARMPSKAQRFYL